jgi:hypothetical protein
LRSRAVRAAELYRRPPVLVGDEPAVVRYRRRFRARRRVVQAGFVGGVVAIGLALRVAGEDGLLQGALSFGALSTSFMVVHLAVGKRMWIKPMEVYEDGVAGSRLTLLFCKRRFVPWKEVEAVELGGEKAAVLRVRTLSGRFLESAPGEFEEAGAAQMRQMLAAAKAEAAAQKALFESVGQGGGSHP